jgi:2,4-dienoyl-CoA reductase-like NADH-dependent reductase (Old Yellow Enzyme family)
MINPAVPAFREVLDVPLIACGKVWTAADVAAVLDRGADMVAVGKAGIANPDWPRELDAPRPPWSELEAVSPRFREYLRGMKLIATD